MRETVHIRGHLRRGYRLLEHEPIVLAQRHIELIGPHVSQSIEATVRDLALDRREFERYSCNGRPQARKHLYFVSFDVDLDELRHAVLTN